MLRKFLLDLDTEINCFHNEMYEKEKKLKTDELKKINTQHISRNMEELLYTVVRNDKKIFQHCNKKLINLRFFFLETYIIQ